MNVSIYIMVIAAIAAIVAVMIIKNRTEGFTNVPPTAITSTFNPLASVVVSNDKVAADINTNIQLATNFTGIVAHSSTAASTTENPSYLGVSTEPELIKNATTCEAVRFTDINSCGSIPATCGFCLKGGKTHDGQVGRIGLYLSPAEKAAEDALATAQGRLPRYQPTAVGQATCAPGYFFVNRTECETGAKRVGCEAGGKLDSTCGQCLNSTGEFVYVGPAPVSFNARLRIITDGTVTVNVGNTKIGTVSAYWGQETVVSLPGISEGNILTINISGSTHKRCVGQLESDTGDRKIALDKIVALPTAAIQRYGTLSSAVHPTMIQNAFWVWSNDMTATAATFQGVIPVTLAPPAYSEDIKRCPTGPFVMTTAGQKLLDADPCGSGTLTPGCMKYMWTSGGCTDSGKMSAVAAKYTTPGDFSAAVADMATITTTGKHTDGRDATRDEIVEAAAQCTGQKLSPCDGPFKHTGPLSYECVKSIYKDPTTYDSSIPPCTINGKLYKDIVASKDNWKSRKGDTVESIQSLLKWFQQSAAGTYPKTTPEMQKASMIACYGVDIVGSEPKTCPVYVPPLSAGKRVSLMINDGSQRYVRHASFALWVMTNDSGALFQNDGTFTLRVGSSSGTYKMEAVNFPGYFLTVPDNGSQGRLVSGGGTDFKITTTSTGASLITLPSGKYIAIIQSNQVAASATAATWLIKNPLLPN